MGIHDDHRKRVKARYLEFGAEVFDDYQLLELYLFYSNPRADVNPLAHQLINQFGSLPGVLNASVEELTAVKGVGEHAAISLRLISDLNRRSQMARSSRKDLITSAEDGAEYLIPHFYGSQVELVYLLCLDPQGRVLHCSRLSGGDGTPTFASFDQRKLIAAALEHRASSVLLAHNHLSGSTEPSQEDLDATRHAAQALRMIHVHLLDHLIIADNDYRSLRQSGLLNWDLL